MTKYIACRFFFALLNVLLKNLRAESAFLQCDKIFWDDEVAWQRYNKMLYSKLPAAKSYKFQVNLYTLVKTFKLLQFTSWSNADLAMKFCVEIKHFRLRKQCSAIVLMRLICQSHYIELSTQLPQTLFHNSSIITQWH